MQWLRLYHDTSIDPKWRLVSNESGQPVGNVLAVWMEMLICASASSERGTLEDWSDRIVAAHLGYKTDAVTAIRDAMQGVVLDGNKLTGWEKRQRASDNAGERQKKTRSRRQFEPKTEKTDDEGGQSGDHGGNGHDPDGHATVARQTDDVARQTGSVARLPLRAQTPESKKEDSVASATGPEGPPRSLKSELFGKCLEYLTEASGRPATQLRKMIGRWIAAHGEGAVLDAIAVAQRDAAVSPVGYIEKVLKTRSAKNGGQGNGSKHDRLIHGLAGAFSDLLDPRPEDSSGDGREVARRYH